MQRNAPVDAKARLFYFALPWTIPVIVTVGTYAFYPVARAGNMVWIPLVLIYWATLWAYTLGYRRWKGGVFSKERFKVTLRLQGEKRWLQYLLVYGPFSYTIPLFIMNYALNPTITVQMYVTIILASIMNGFSEEMYWRACMEDSGVLAGVSEKHRLAYAPVAFASWHTAFVIHFFPFGPSWWVTWATFMLMTWTSGLAWTWVLQKSGRLFPQVFYHQCSNALSVFPLLLVSVLGFFF